MSLLGKILAVLNVLAALAFVAIAALDWGQRQAWTYAVYRMDLATEGLPIDVNEADLNGDRRIDRLSDKTYRSYMGLPDDPNAAAVNPEEKTQLAVVKAKRDELRAELSNANGNAFKERLAALLVPPERTLPAREALQKQIATGERPALLGETGPFEQAFKQVIEEGQGKDLPPEHRRGAIAHLLFSISQTPEERQRVVKVVGVKEYARAATRQAAALRSMIEQENVALGTDRSHYVNDYQHKIAHLESLARDLKSREIDLANHKQVLAQHETLLKARQSDVRLLQDQLEAARKETGLALDALAKEQRRLFDAQHNVGQSVDRNEKLEREISRKENVTP